MPHSHDAPVLWTADEEAILLSHYTKLTYEQIAELLPGRTWMAVRHRANVLGLTGTSNLGRRYCANKDFFAVPNVLNAYWAGFLAADGNVRGNKLSVGLAPKDAAHVERLQTALGYTGKLYRRAKVVGLQVACQEMTDDLSRNFNVTERKSRTLEPPPLVDEVLVKAFIVGLIDGDGSIGLKRYQQYEHLRIVIYGTLAILEWVREYFDRWTGTGSRPLSQVHAMTDGRHLHAYKISAARAITVGKLLLDVDVPRLERKWGLVRQLIQDAPIPESVV